MGLGEEKSVLALFSSVSAELLHGGHRRLVPPASWDGIPCPRDPGQIRALKALAVFSEDTLHLLERTFDSLYSSTVIMSILGDLF